MPELPASSPRIAGVVINYNYEKFVGAAIQSLLDQTKPFHEVLVVDDGSTDSSWSVIADYLDRVTFISQDNGGQLSAAWTAVNATDADYVYILDSDDIADPSLVARVSEYLEDEPVKVQFQLHGMTADGEATDSVFPTFAQGYDSARMVHDNEVLGFYVCPPTSGNVFRRDLLAPMTQADFDTREAFDGVPAQLAPWFGKVVSLNEPLVRYRVHGDSDSQWGRPTPELLERELARYDNRWREVGAYLRNSGLKVPDSARSAYVHERRLMIDVLEGRRPRIQNIVAFADRIRASGLTRKQKILLVLWSISLLFVSRRRARGLVISRRSPQGRGRFLTAAARLARRGASLRHA